MKLPFKFGCLAIAVFFALLSCQKSADNSNNSSGGSTDSTKATNDSALAYTRIFYLWYDQIPSNYDPSKFSSPVDLMQDIRKYSKETGYADPVDRFSFAVKRSDWDNTSSGQQADFGFSVFFLGGTNKLYVKYVEQDGAAGKAGIQRGWQITKINGSSNVDTTTASINTIVDAVFGSTNTSFSFLKPDGSTADITLQAINYQTHPVMADTVLELSNGSKVGYMVFSSFLGDSLDIDYNFKRVFQKFEAGNISDLVVDLRYNGGGYVYNAEKLSNYLAPVAANGQVMFTEKYNSKFSQYNETFNYQKIGNLNLSRIFFIVSDQTASASELVINNLKPYMSVYLVGPAYHTYGKPVGFFPIPINNDWYILPVSFKSINKNGQSDYYNGFTIDKPVNDGVNRNWGDVTENCLASTLKYIQTGSFRLGTAQDKYEPIIPDSKLSNMGFKGAVSNKRPL